MLRENYRESLEAMMCGSDLKEGEVRVVEGLGKELAGLWEVVTRNPAAMEKG